MIFRRGFFRIILGLAALAILAGRALGQPVIRQLAAGVTLAQEIDTDPSAPLIVNELTVDLAHAGVSVRAALGCDVVLRDNHTKGREKISSLTARKGALVGVNAGYFPFTGEPLDVCIIDGGLVCHPNGKRATLAITKDHKIFFDTPRFDAKLTFANGVSRKIDGISRSRESNQVVVYTGTFGECTFQRYPSTDLVLTSDDLPVRVGKPLRMKIRTHRDRRRQHPHSQTRGGRERRRPGG